MSASAQRKSQRKPDALSAARVTLADIRRAAAAIDGQIMRTPMRQSRTLSGISGCDVWFKFENLQFTAAFK